MRLKLTAPLHSRDGTLARGARMKNLLAKVKGDIVKATKRPGAAVLLSGVGTNGQGMIGFKSQGFKGEWRGASFVTNAQVVNDGTDDFGAAYLPGGCAYMELTVDQIRSVITDNDFLNAAPAGSTMYVEKDRTANKHITEFVGAMIAGAILNEDEMGSTIQTVD